MWTTFILCVIVSALGAAGNKEPKSSSIYDTESHHDVHDSSDSGVSESGLSKSKPSSESDSDLAVGWLYYKLGSLRKPK